MESKNTNRLGFGGKPVGQGQGSQPRQIGKSQGIQPNPNMIAPKNRSKMEPKTRSKMEPKNRTGFGGRPVGMGAESTQQQMAEAGPKVRTGFGGKPVGEGVQSRQPKMQTPCNFFQESRDSISTSQVSQRCHCKFKLKFSEYQ